MKSFDLFQKVTVDNKSSATCNGAILSLLAISIMLYVFVKQLNEYFFYPTIQKDSVIFQDNTHISKVPVNLGIKFQNLPCSIISVDQEDLIGHHRLNIEDTIDKITLDKESNPNNNKFDSYKTDKLKQAIKDQNGCFIEGFIPISKVQGDIHISFHAYRDVYSFILETDLHTQISMSHKFTLLNFGDQEVSRGILEKFRMNDQINNFNRVVNLPNHENVEYNKVFDYFIKIIPQIFYDEYTGEQTIAYQYSLTSKSKESDSWGEMPIVMINYDYSPVAVKYTLKKYPFSHLVTNICALLGGVFVIFSILNSFLNRISEHLEDSDVKIGRSSIN